MKNLRSCAECGRDKIGECDAFYCRGGEGDLPRRLRGGIEGIDLIRVNKDESGTNEVTRRKQFVKDDAPTGSAAWEEGR